MRIDVNACCEPRLSISDRWCECTVGELSVRSEIGTGATETPGAKLPDVGSQGFTELGNVPA